MGRAPHRRCVLGMAARQCFNVRRVARVSLRFAFVEWDCLAFRSSETLSFSDFLTACLRSLALCFDGSPLCISTRGFHSLYAAAMGTHNARLHCIGCCRCVIALDIC